jgi:hypothetical protein
LLVGKVQIKWKPNLNWNARENVDLIRRTGRTHDTAINLNHAKTVRFHLWSNLTEVISQLPCQSR